MTAHARSGDPWTSWAAADSVDVTSSQDAVRWLFDGGYAIRPRDGLRALTLEEIVDAIHSCDAVMRWPRFSDSRIRTAVAELIAAAWLVDTGRTARTRAGRQARLIGRPDVQQALKLN